MAGKTLFQGVKLSESVGLSCLTAQGCWFISAGSEWVSVQVLGAVGVCKCLVVSSQCRIWGISLSKSRRPVVVSVVIAASFFLPISLAVRKFVRIFAAGF